jgi:hypothetical protein
LSPEYTIVSAIDASCVLFAVKENQNFGNVYSGQSPGNAESRPSSHGSQLLQSPEMMPRNFFEQRVNYFDGDDESIY